jgi:hypothetical protein
MAHGVQSALRRTLRRWPGSSTTGSGAGMQLSMPSPDNAGTKPARPQRAAAAVGAVNVLNIALPPCFNNGTLCLCRRKQQAHGVGHQHVGVHRAAELARDLGKVAETRADRPPRRRNRRCGYYPAGSGEAEHPRAQFGRNEASERYSGVVNGSEILPKTWSVP